MMSAGLSLEQAPPFNVPLRFFLTAPGFLMLAALLLLWQGPQTLASRWTPATLALTHLLALGFMAQVMLGALLQMLPVVVGVIVPRPQWIAALVHVPLMLGTLLLAGALLSGDAVVLKLAWWLLGWAFGLALVVFSTAVWRAPIANGTVIAMRCALGGLLATVGLGLLLGGFLAWGWQLPIVQLVNMHAAWGLLGWTLLLVASVAYQVVPMFQMTPPYPAWFVRGFALAIGGLLIVWTIAAGAGWHWGGLLAGGLLAVGVILFAGLTLYLLAQRRRRIGDATLNYWHVSMISLIGGALLWLSAQAFPLLLDMPSVDVLLGILLIFGFAMATINGMLYKIVPFLAWFHLQAQCFQRTKTPNMKQLLPDAAIQRQWWVFLAALLLSLAAAVYPFVFTYPAALALGGAGVGLGLDLLAIWKSYRRVSRQEPAR